MRVVSLGLGLAFGLMAAGTVFAADLVIEPVSVMPAAESDWHPYVKAYGGATLPNNLAFDGTDYDVDAGWLLGGALGVQIMENVAFELDGTYSTANYTDSADPLDTATLMANVVISGPLSDQIAIYGGLGLGAIGAQYDGGEWAYGAGGQIFAGVSLEVADNVSLFAEARYQTAFDLLTLDIWPSEVNHTAVLAGIKLGF